MTETKYTLVLDLTAEEISEITIALNRGIAMENARRVLIADRWEAAAEEALLNPIPEPRPAPPGTARLVAPPDPAFRSRPATRLVAPSPAQAAQDRLAAAKPTPQRRGRRRGKRS